jgi:hypothetical protein
VETPPDVRGLTNEEVATLPIAVFSKQLLEAIDLDRKVPTPGRLAPFLSSDVPVVEQVEQQQQDSESHQQNQERTPPVVLWTPMMRRLGVFDTAPSDFKEEKTEESKSSSSSPLWSPVSSASSSPCPSPRGNPRSADENEGDLDQIIVSESSAADEDHACSSASESMSSATTSAPTSSSSLATCTICLSSIDVGERVLVLPHCLHFCHATCSARWLLTKNSCPVCRAKAIDWT